MYYRGDTARGRAGRGAGAGGARGGCGRPLDRSKLCLKLIYLCFRDCNFVWMNDDGVLFEKFK